MPIGRTEVTTEMVKTWPCLTISKSGIMPIGRRLRLCRGWIGISYAPVKIEDNGTQEDKIAQDNFIPIKLYNNSDYPDHCKCKPSWIYIEDSYLSGLPRISIYIYTLRLHAPHVAFRISLSIVVRIATDLLSYFGLHSFTITLLYYILLRITAYNNCDEYYGLRRSSIILSLNIIHMDYYSQLKAHENLFHWISPPWE
jgi:hypothetical protein